MSGWLPASQRTLLETIAEHLSLKQISAIISASDKKTVNFLCEVALNLVGTQDCGLSTEDKAPLKPYKKQLVIIINKRQSLTKRRQTLAAKPFIIKTISRLALICANE